MSKTAIFLGGTVGKNPWRKSFIADLVNAGVEADAIYDPVVEDWTPECQAAEDEAKRVAQYNLFYLTDPQQEGINVSAYSLVEAIMGLYDQPATTVVVFDNNDYTGHVLKALTKSEQDLRKRFPEALIFSSRQQAIDYFTGKLGQSAAISA